MKTGTTEQTNRDFKLGEWGEKEVQKLMKINHNIDLYKGKGGWKDVDIDFIADKEEAEDYNPSRPMFPGLKVEVKTDDTIHPNTAVEIISNSNTFSPGWIYVTQSDYLAVVRPKFNKVIFYNTQKLKQYTFNNMNTAQLKDIATYDVYIENKQLYKSKIIPFNMNKLKQAGVVVAEYTLNNNYSQTYVNMNHKD